MKLEVIFPCFIGGVSRAAGEVVELSDNDGFMALGSGRLKIATAEQPSQTKDESVAPIQTDVRESSMPPRRRR